MGMHYAFKNGPLSIDGNNCVCDTALRALMLANFDKPHKWGYKNIDGLVKRIKEFRIKIGASATGSLNLGDEKMTDLFYKQQIGVVFFRTIRGQRKEPNLKYWFPTFEHHGDKAKMKELLANGFRNRVKYYFLWSSEYIDSMRNGTGYADALGQKPKVEGQPFKLLWTRDEFVTQIFEKMYPEWKENKGEIWR